MTDAGFTYGETSGATLGQTSGGTLGLKTPRAPSSLTVTQGAEDELDLSWSQNDLASEYRIYRATSSGSTRADYTQLTSVSGPGTTTYTDTGLLDGEQYYYRVDAANDAGTSGLSPEDSAVTVLPAPTGLSTTSIDKQQIDLSWTDESDNEDGFRVDQSRDGGATYTQVADLAAGTTSYSDTGLLNGEKYTYRVKSYTNHTESASGTSASITTLPDEDQPVLDTSTEDEVGVDRGSQVSNYKDVRIQIRETGETSWDANATGFAETVIDHATLSTTFTGREDGEEYEVRARTETEHVDGAWTSPVSAITLLPAATNLSLSNLTQTSVDVAWTDNADNETEFRIQHRKQFNAGFGPWRTITTVGANTTSGTDDALQPNRTYQFRVVTVTDDTTTASASVQDTTPSAGVRQDRVPSQGWYVEIEVEK